MRQSKVVKIPKTYKRQENHPKNCFVMHSKVVKDQKLHKNNFMYSLLTCLIHAVYVIVTVCYHPIKSLNPHFNRWFDSKYLFMFYIISSTYHHKKKTLLIPWAGSHEYYVNLNEREHVMMDTQYAIKTFM